MKDLYQVNIDQHHQLDTQTVAARKILLKEMKRDLIIPIFLDLSYFICFLDLYVLYVDVIVRFSYCMLRFVLRNKNFE